MAAVALMGDDQIIIIIIIILSHIRIMAETPPSR
jgi:hypothetical protein